MLSIFIWISGILAGRSFALAQIEQNNRNVTPDYLIGLGHLYRRVEVLVADLAAASFD